MIVGIDIRVLGNETKSGIEEYTENLLAHLLPLDSKIKFKLFYSSRKSNLKDYSLFGKTQGHTERSRMYDWLGLPNVELKQFQIPSKLLFGSSRFLDRPHIDKMIGGVDVFFSPHFILTSLSPECRRVVTFHDLSYEHFPEFFSWRRNLWHGFEMKPTWQSKLADRIIAVSESTKEDLIKKYEVDPVKIKVVYSGIDPDIKRPEDGLLEEFRIKNHLPKKFILFLGKLEPRKNIMSLVKAFKSLKEENRYKDLRLVIAGSRGWLDETIFREARSGNYKDQVLFIDQISDRDRKYYYSLASIFIYPSFFEGFGLPPVEAMSCGTPVITSHGSSLPEVMGEAGLMIDSHNINDLKSSISLLLENQKLATHLSAIGLKKARSFSWHRAANETLECLVR